MQQRFLRVRDNREHEHVITAVSVTGTCAALQPITSVVTVWIVHSPETLVEIISARTDVLVWFHCLRLTFDRISAGRVSCAVHPGRGMPRCAPTRDFAMHPSVGMPRCQLCLLLLSRGYVYNGAFISVLSTCVVIDNT